MRCPVIYIGYKVNIRKECCEALCVFGRLHNVERVAQPVYFVSPSRVGAENMDRPIFCTVLWGTERMKYDETSLWSFAGKSGWPV